MPPSKLPDVTFNNFDADSTYDMEEPQVLASSEVAEQAIWGNVALNSAAETANDIGDGAWGSQESQKGLQDVSNFGDGSWAASDLNATRVTPKSSNQSNLVGCFVSSQNSQDLSDADPVPLFLSESAIKPIYDFSGMESSREELPIDLSSKENVAPTM
jgi:hypothetical protein